MQRSSVRMRFNAPGAWIPLCVRMLVLLAAIESTPPPHGAACPPATPRVGFEVDYHRNCRTKERGGCSHWEGLSCTEVDAILHNVRRYEKQVHQDSQPEAAASTTAALTPAENDGRLPLRGSLAEHKTRGHHSQYSMHDSGQYHQWPPPQPSTDAMPQAPAASRGLFQPLAGQAPPPPHTYETATQESVAALEHSQTQHARLRQSARTRPENARSSAKVASFPVVDTDGHTKYRLGDGLEPSPAFPRGRYKILRSLGSGTYGKVVECWDRQAMAYCAVKVVRAVPKYKKAAELEVSVLLQLQGHHGCVRLLRHFEYQGHICMSFELLGPNLYEIMRACNFRPFALGHVRRIAAQVMEALCLVHGRSIVHTDVKPENILLVEQVHKKGLVMQDGGVALDQLQVKLVDFGSAVHRSWRHPSVVSTRHYRAPEIMMQLGWSYAVDMWSMGCILVELWTGEVLFGIGPSQADNTLAHLAAIHSLLGPFPLEMVHRARANGLEGSLFPADAMAAAGGRGEGADLDCGAVGRGAGADLEAFACDSPVCARACTHASVRG